MLHLFLLITVACFMSCQQKTEKIDVPEKPIILRVPISEEDAIHKSAFAFVPAVAGIKIEGTDITKEGEFSKASEVKFLDTFRNKVLDDFSSFTWGSIKFKSEDKLISVFLTEDLIIKYSSDGKKVLRTAQCEFKNFPVQNEVQKILAQTKEPNADWETIFYSLGDLAKKGDPVSYKFFMKPSLENAKLIKDHSDGAASVEPIITAIKFMEDNGCRWRL